MEEGLRENAPAKLNLFLHITGRRSDGYHLMQSGVIFIDLADELTAEPANDWGLTITGLGAETLQQDGANNLVLKAAQLFEAEHPLSTRYHFHLHKRIPAGAGLGGGSADAAATLRLLNRCLPEPLPFAALEPLAARLGADVPACLHSKPCLMEGTGEQLSFITLPDVWQKMTLLLSWPEEGLATAEVYHTYKKITPSRTKSRNLDTSTQSLRSLGRDDVIEWSPARLRAHTRNDLQPAALQLLPSLQDQLDNLAAQRGTLFARMTGSGSACFAVAEGKTGALPVGMIAVKLSSPLPNTPLIPVQTGIT